MCSELAVFPTTWAHVPAGRGPPLAEGGPGGLGEGAAGGGDRAGVWRGVVTKPLRIRHRDQPPSAPRRGQALKRYMRPEWFEELLEDLRPGDRTNC